MHFPASTYTAEALLTTEVSKCKQCRRGLQWSHGSGGVCTGKMCFCPAGLVKLHKESRKC